MIWAKQSTVKTLTVGPILDEDGVAKTDEVVASIEASKNGGAYGALDGSATLTHDHTGVYRLALTANDYDTLGVLELSLNSGTNAMAPVRVMVLPANVYDSLVSGSDLLDVNAKEISDDSDAAEKLLAFLELENRHFYAVKNTVSVGDLCYMEDSDNVAHPASDMADIGSEPSNQEAFARRFVGVCVAYSIPDGETVGTGLFAMRAVRTFDCSDDTYAAGDLVGPDETGGNQLMDQTVTKVAQACYAIGVAADGVTGIKVKVMLFGRSPTIDWEDGRRLDEILDARAATGADGDTLKILSEQLDAVKIDTGNLVTRITANLFTGITKMANWLRLMCRSDPAIGTDAATELGEINNDEGSGAGDYGQADDALEGLSDQIDAIPTNPMLNTEDGSSFSSIPDMATATGQTTTQAAIAALNDLSEANIRTAVGLAAANLDTQLGDIPTVAEFNARTLVAAQYATAAGQTTTQAAIAALNNLSQADIRTAVGLAAADLDTQLGNIKTDTTAILLDTSTTLDDFVDECEALLKNATYGLAAVKNDTAAILTDTNELQLDWENGGRLDNILDAIAGYIDTEIAAIKAVTDNLPNSGTLTDLASDVTAVKAKTDNLKDSWNDPTAAAVAQAAWTLANAIAGKTPAQAMRYIGAMLAGVCSGAGTGTEAFQDFAGDLAATVTADVAGNRSSVVYNDP